MSPLERMSRNTLMLVPLVVIWLSLYGAALLYVEQAAFPSAALIVVAILVAAGLPPGSFLRSPLDRLASAASKGSSRVLTFLAIASPSLLVVFASLIAYSHWNYLQFADEYGLPFTRHSIALPLSGIAALVGLAVLVLNIWAIARAASTHGSSKG